MQPSQDLVKSQASLATLNQLIAKYNQLYATYLQQVQIESSKNQTRKYPYNIQNPNEIKNTLTPDNPFPSNGTEEACFKSCVDTKDCMYALYSNSGCGIDCNPNKCLLYGANAEGVVPANEVSNNLPACPASGDSTDSWCQDFNHPVVNSIIPVFVLRNGGTDWRTLAMQMPKATVNAADAPMTVDLTTNVQTWMPDSQFADVNYAPQNEVSMQFRFFAEYWLNAYGLQSGETSVITTQGTIGIFTFAKMSSGAGAGNGNGTPYVGSFVSFVFPNSQVMYWNSETPSTGGTAEGLKTAAALAATSESSKFTYNYSAFEKSSWKIQNNFDAMGGQIPPQLAGMSVPSWQFLGLQDSAEDCQRAANDDADHVYDIAVYHNASFDNGNSVYSRACYGHVAGAPESTISNDPLNDVQTMTPPSGFTKMAGKSGILILKKLYNLNQQIMALTNELKISSSQDPAQSIQEPFTQQGTDADADADANANADAVLRDLAKKLEVDAANLNEEIQAQNKLEGDEKNAERVLLYSRIKLVVAVLLGLFLAYLAYRFLTADELPATIKNEIMPSSTGSTSSNGYLDGSSNDLE